MPRKINYEDVLAFRAPRWVKVAADADRGPGEDRSDVLRRIVIPYFADQSVDQEEEEE